MIKRSYFMRLKLAFFHEIKSFYKILQYCSGDQKGAKGPKGVIISGFFLWLNLTLPNLTPNPEVLKLFCIATLSKYFQNFVTLEFLRPQRVFGHLIIIFNSIYRNEFIKLAKQVTEKMKKLMNLMWLLWQTKFF